MSVHRFVAATQREAMRRVRETLGDDALILANRPAPGGVEILALREGEPQAPPADEALPVTAGDADVSRLLLKEVETLRTLLRRREQDQAEPLPLASTLRGAGFGPALVADLLTGLPEEVTTDEAARAWGIRQLARRLRAHEQPWEHLAAGGVLALVGPTGVGKTTTAGKLAAHYALRWGADQVALVSADGYRAAARDQLRVYAQRLGVDLHVLESGRTLASLAAVLNGKRLVIIDTVGLSQRDPRLGEGLAPLIGGARATRAVLLLNAASQPETLDEVSTHYRRAAQQAGLALDDVIISKCDEAVRLAPLLDVVMRQGVRPWFVCHGQRVPEDLTGVDAEALVGEALGGDLYEAMSVSPPPFNTPAFNPLAQGSTLMEALADLRRDAPAFPWLEKVMAGHWQATAPTPSMQSQGWLFWPGRRDPAALMLDENGGAGPLWLAAQRSLIRQLDWCRRHYSTLTPVLPGPPPASAWLWLDRQEQPWLARARAQTRVRYQGLEQPLWALREQAVEQGEALLRRNGRTLRVSLRALPVAGAAGERYRGLVNAWFLQARDPDTDRVRGWLYALLPLSWPVSQARPHLQALWRARGITELWEPALRALPSDAPVLPRHTAAVSLAGLACRLDEEQRDWAVATRGRLLGLCGQRRRRSPRRLMEALLHVLRTHNALRRLGEP